MTKKTITTYASTLVLAALMAGAATIYTTGVASAQSTGSEVTGTISSDSSTASEVTGTISSDTTDSPKADGDLTGTVSSDTETETDGTLSGNVTSDSGNLTGTVSGGGGGSGSSGGGGGSVIGGTGGVSTTDDTVDEPSGAVLGETVSVTQTPHFPNAGSAPEAHATDQSFWSFIMNLFKQILSH